MPIIELLDLINKAADERSADKLARLQYRVSDLMIPEEDKQVLLATIDLALSYICLESED